MSNLYTGNGAVISVGGGEVSPNQIKTALISAVASGDVNLGSAVGATLAYTSPGTDWETHANTAYQNLLTAYKKIPNSGVPFFISADQHGLGVEQHRWLNNADVDGMEVLSFNLGDTVNDKFSLYELEPVLARTKQVKNYIATPGNHDKSQNLSVAGAPIANDYDLNRFFMTTMPHVKTTSPAQCFTVLDGAHNVKVMAVDTYFFDNIEEGLAGWHISTPVAEWIISELESKDDKDILWANHTPIWDTWQQRDDTEETAAEGIVSGYLALWQVLVDRKNKASGTYTDKDGVVHSYDFSDCKSDLLCCLHGHIHTEWYSTVKGLTAYAAAYYGKTKCCTFGLIDRENSKVTFWVFDNTGCRDPLELPI